MDDDWLVDEHELSADNYQQYVSDREWNALKNEFTKSGYREGVQQGADQARQTGFEQGFASGGPTLFSTGYQIGLLDTLKTFYARSDAPALSAEQSSALESLVRELEAVDVLTENEQTRTARGARIQRLADELQLGTVPSAL